MFRVGRDKDHFINFDNLHLSLAFADAVDCAGVHNDDVVVFCFGEIDCRCHIHRQVDLGRDANQVIRELVDAYIDVITANARRRPKLHIIVCGVVPPRDFESFTRVHGIITHAFPFVGTDEQRVQYTRSMNARLRETSDQYGYVFLDVFADYANSVGILPEQISDGNSHIGDTRAVQLQLQNILERFNAKTPTEVQ